MVSSAAAEKSAEELRKEIEELKRQQWEITERLRDPRGIRRAGLGQKGPRPIQSRQRGLVRPNDRTELEDQPLPKRRLSSAVIKVGGESEESVTVLEKDGEAMTVDVGKESKRPSTFGLQGIGPRRMGIRKNNNINYDVPSEEHTPRVMPKNEDPNLVKRNRRMLSQLLGTLEKFREEDKQLSSTDSYMRRSDSLKIAEQRAQEESEKLRKQEREQIEEKRKRDFTLRARVAAKAEEKKLELLFLRWSDHQKTLCNYLRTNTNPRIYYLPKKLDSDLADIEQAKEQTYLEWKTSRRAELTEFQKQLEEQYVANVELQQERRQNSWNTRKANDLVNLQESMDKELETHQLEHGPKTRRILGNNDEEEDVEDITAEDDMMDDVLGIGENRRADGDVPDASGHAGDFEAINDSKI
ncbi:Protein-protein interaction regulator family protein [Zostera marina]|uniref:Protein-protein interaction regulator family protein n=1 Tax=Zostera marina TaxID=29655 RepID=A0A0K9Q0R3_ZOSMR|nr:Protein-protein interaction regulator family protein [Zostera marina]